MAWCFTFGTVLWHIKSACQENWSLQKRVKKLKGYSDESQLQLFLQVPSSFMLQNFFPVFSLRVWGLFLLPLLGLLELQLRRHQVIFQLALKGKERFDCVKGFFTYPTYPHVYLRYTREWNYEEIHFTVILWSGKTTSVEQTQAIIFLAGIPS